MAGWNLKAGTITKYDVSEDEMWSLFNFVFSESSMKKTSYKFGLIKSILDNMLNGEETPMGVFFPYEKIFYKFSENYWNLVVKYNLRQMIYGTNAELSKIEIILREFVETDKILGFIDFDSIEETKKKSIVKKVTYECKKNVIGALYNDFEGKVYSFDLKVDGITISYTAFHFMLKYKTALEKLNYYAWARFLEKTNSDNVLVRVVDKLELATPRRENLSVYRNILRKEFEYNNCFYCGKKLENNVHVDHFIPWSFIKDDKIWNFVLACPSCNEKKNNRLPGIPYLEKIIERNNIIKDSQSNIIQTEFANYSEDLITRMCNYAKLSGMKEFNFL